MRKAFCSKCGTQLDKDTRLCPVCNIEKIEKLKNKNDGDSTGKLKKAIVIMVICLLILCFACIAVFLLSGGNKNLIKGTITINADEVDYAQVEVVFENVDDPDKVYCAQVDKNGNYEVRLPDGNYNRVIYYQDEEINRQDNFDVSTKDTDSDAVIENEEFVYHFNDVIILKDKGVFADGRGVWTFDRESEPVKIASCDASGITSNGEVIYYGVFNEEKTSYSKQADMQMQWNQYDIYTIKYDGTGNKKLFSCVEKGEPITVIDNKLYYTDYKDDYDGFAVGLSHSLFSYDLKTKKRVHIADGAAWVYSLNGKLYYHNFVMDAGNSYIKLYCYDTKTEKISKVSEKNVTRAEIVGDKICYVTCEYNVDGKGTYTEVHYVDPVTDTDTKVFKKTVLDGYVIFNYFDEDYIYYRHDVGTDHVLYYRYSIKDDQTEEINGLNSKEYYHMTSNDGELYYYTSDYELGDYEFINIDTQTLQVSNSRMNFKQDSFLQAGLSMVFFGNNEHDSVNAIIEYEFLE